MKVYEIGSFFSLDVKVKKSMSILRFDLCCLVILFGL